MELWLDTTDGKVIAEANELGILSGVTTNPSILSKEKSSPEITLKRLLDIQPGFVAAQVTTDDLPGMLRQAENLSKLCSNNRLIVKIPASQNGYRAMALLKKQGIPTLATTVFEAKQLILSSFAGATYLAPYVSHIDASIGNALNVLKEMQETVAAQKFSIKIMAAAIRSPEQFCECARIGIPAITIPVNVYKDMFSASSFVDVHLEKFKKEWQENKVTATSELFCY
ncbi:MAG: Uncharacterized protein K0R08_1853 [Solimicrobium sp.]|jgi:transaldolase|nr:Uncharacterized protein [Solimicrobium sp.]